jgi:hypothetical protein
MELRCDVLYGVRTKLCDPFPDLLLDGPT